MVSNRLIARELESKVELLRIMAEELKNIGDEKKIIENMLSGVVNADPRILRTFYIYIIETGII